MCSDINYSSVNDNQVSFKVTRTWRTGGGSSTRYCTLSLFQELQPLYHEIHAYVRKRLRMLHGRDLFSRSGHIPAHLLGLY